MNLRTNLDGTYTSEDIDRLGWPVAWSGTVSAEDRAAQSADLAELIEECRETLRSEPDAIGVEISNGELISVIMGGDEE